MKLHRILPCLLALTLFPGCALMQKMFHRDKPGETPTLLTSTNPTLDQLTTAINRNSMMIRSMTTEDASIMVPGVMLPVRSNIAFERPKRLRIRGGATSLTGQELDFGSNDSIFWLWVRRLPEKEIYYCRHDQFPTCPVRTMIPIEPDWIIEALGICEFQVGEPIEGPFPTDDGKLAIVSRRQTAAGQFIKKTVVDPKSGWILRQEMFSPQNELVAMAILSDHRYDRGSGIVYARRIEVQSQGAEGKMTIDIGTPTFNSPAASASNLFTMPAFDGYRPVDICGPEFLRNHGVVVPMPQQSSGTMPGSPNPGLNPMPNTVPAAMTPLNMPSIQQPYPPQSMVSSTSNAGPTIQYEVPATSQVYQQPTPEANVQTIVR